MVLSVLDGLTRLTCVFGVMSGVRVLPLSGRVIIMQLGWVSDRFAVIVVCANMSWVSIGLPSVWLISLDVLSMVVFGVVLVGRSSGIRLFVVRIALLGRLWVVVSIGIALL